ncbi:MAG: hypothetical protein JST00_34310 [Deltaproteobacteria bacterium]|nr:hypothetical protein [Deltaproteobacteria bacterium]
MRSCALLLGLCLSAVTLGCSTFEQISGGAHVGSERGQGLAGGGVSAHYGLGGRVHRGEEPLAVTNVFMPMGIDIMARVHVNDRFTSVAYAGSGYFDADIGKHTGFGRLGYLFQCNFRDPVLCALGGRAEVGFGITLAESERTVPGIFVEERRRAKSLLTISLFGEYAGYLSRRTELPMLGLEVGYAYDDVLFDVSRGQIFR